MKASARPAAAGTHGIRAPLHQCLELAGAGAQTQASERAGLFEVWSDVVQELLEGLLELHSILLALRAEELPLALLERFVAREHQREDRLPERPLVGHAGVVEEYDVEEKHQQVRVLRRALGEVRAQGVGRWAVLARVAEMERGHVIHGSGAVGGHRGVERAAEAGVACGGGAGGRQQSTPHEMKRVTPWVDCTAHGLLQHYGAGRMSTKMTSKRNRNAGRSSQIRVQFGETGLLSPTRA